jgi:hypothetical protein
MAATILEPDQWSDMSDSSDISALEVRYIRPEASAKALELDWRPDMFDTSDISGLELVPRFYNLMKISDLVGYI